MVDNRGNVKEKGADPPPPHELNIKIQSTDINDELFFIKYNYKLILNN